MSTENELRSRVCDQARAWLGRKEADRSHREIIDLYNRNRLPGTYAMSYDDPWCAAFVSAVGMACGLRDVILPHVNCDGMIASYKLAGRWIENDAYSPQPGDLIFYDWQDSGAGDCTGGADHVGIVTAVNGQLIVAIEGNYSDSVKQRYIFADGRFVRGFAVPDYASAAGAADTDVGDTGAGTIEDKPAGAVSTGSSAPEAELRRFPLLARGSRGWPVVTLQGALIAHGYSCGPDGPDGDFGYNTQNAVCRFQRDSALTVDGVVGDKTWTRLLG